MKGLLSLLALVFVLSACAGPSALDPDIWYDSAGYAHLTKEAKERIEKRATERLNGYGFAHVERRGEVNLRKEGTFRVNGGGCTLDFLYLSRTDQLVLIVGTNGDRVDTASFQSKKELSEKVKQQLRCDLPAS